MLIFTQMTRMLDVLEVFLNLHGYTYSRLDGSTKVEKRQQLTERFNTDPKIFAFILSTRSGGVGINLTGADSVVFYDSDWNPAMDAQVFRQIPVMTTFAHMFAGARPMPSYWTDSRCTYLPTCHRVHYRGKHFEESQPKETPGRYGYQGRQFYHRFLQKRRRS